MKTFTEKWCNCMMALSLLILLLFAICEAAGAQTTNTGTFYADEARVTPDARAEWHTTPNCLAPLPWPYRFTVALTNCYVGTNGPVDPVTGIRDTNNFAVTFTDTNALDFSYCILFNSAGTSAPSNWAWCSNHVSVFTNQPNIKIHSP